MSARDNQKSLQWLASIMHKTYQEQIAAIQQDCYRYLTMTSYATAQVSKPPTELEKFLSDAYYRSILVLRALKEYRDHVCNSRSKSLDPMYSAEVELDPAHDDVWYACLGLTATFEAPVTGSRNFPVQLGEDEYMVVATQECGGPIYVELFAHRSKDMAVLDELIKREELRLSCQVYSIKASRVPVCECGAEKTNTTHSDWCPIYNP